MGWENSARRGPLTEKHLSWLLLSGITHNMLEMNIGERQGGTLVHLFFPILIIKSNSKNEKSRESKNPRGPQKEFQWACWKILLVLVCLPPRPCKVLSLHLLIRVTFYLITASIHILMLEKDSFI